MKSCEYNDTGNVKSCVDEKGFRRSRATLARLAAAVRLAEPTACQPLSPYVQPPVPVEGLEDCRCFYCDSSDTSCFLTNSILRCGAVPRYSVRQRSRPGIMVDIAALLMEEEAVPCSFLHNARQLAWLDPSARADQPLASSTRLALPLWLSRTLQTHGHAELELPRCFTDAYRKGMRADAPHMDLRAHSDHYFEFGVELARWCTQHAGTRICVPELVGDPDLEEHLLKGFVARFHDFIGASLNATSRSDTATYTRKLTIHERKVFNAGRVAMLNYSKWRSEKTKLEASQLVRRKRRLGEH